MALTFSQKIVLSKIDLLEEGTNIFLKETNEILQLAKSWLGNGESTRSFTCAEINKMVDDKLLLLSYTDLLGNCEELKMQQETATKIPLSSIFISSDEGFPAKCHQSTVVTEQFNTAEMYKWMTPDVTSLFSSSSEKISDKQLAMEKYVESLFDKYSRTEIDKMREIEVALKKMSEKLENTSSEQNTRMQNIENKIEVMANAQSEMDEYVHSQQSILKDQKKETDRFQMQCKQFHHDLSVVLEDIQELGSRINLLENQSINQMQLDALSRQVQFLETNSEIVSINLEDHVATLKQFTKRTEESLNNLSVRGSELENLQKLEEKFTALEINWSEVSEKAEKFQENMEAKYNMMCQLVADRLGPLERLRDIFNKKLDASRDNKTKLDLVFDQLTSLQPKVDQLEIQTQRQAIGFSAGLHIVFIPSQTCKVVTNYKNVLCNIGNHFNPLRGIFTVPVNGIYAISLNVHIKGYHHCQHFRLAVLKISTDVKAQKICVERKVQSMDNCDLSLFAILDLTPREKIYVCDDSTESLTTLSFDLLFTCFKIG